MSWFDTKSFASLAKTALKEAQKKIDKVLDIQEDEMEGSSIAEQTATQGEATTITTELKGAGVRRFPGAANRSGSTDDAKTTDVEHSSMPVSVSTPDLSADNFLKDVEQNEMITTPPKVGEVTKEIEALTKPSTSGLETIAAAAVEMPNKRPSVASTLESVDVLSPPQISPCSDNTTDISESVELITATSDMMTSESSEHILPSTATSDSIVIISRSSDTEIDGELNLNMENLEDSSSFDTKTLVESMEGNVSPNSTYSCLLRNWLAFAVLIFITFIITLPSVILAS